MRDNRRKYKCIQIEKTLKPLKIGELTVEKPIIQGGMGVGVSRSNLAGAVAAEGGIGIIRRLR